MIEQIFTVGGYGFTETSFVYTLSRARVDFFCDVRQRRGMRGSKYAFLNSNRLQGLLSGAGIQYLHFKDFSPTDSIRQSQKDEDSKFGVLKRSRERLGFAFVKGYQAEVLALKSQHDFLDRIPTSISRPCIFCVEREPLACHRSLLADWLSAYKGIPLIHLGPE